MPTKAIIIYLPIPPEMPLNILPSKNIWVVFITNTNQTISFIMHDAHMYLNQGFQNLRTSHVWWAGTLKRKYEPKSFQCWV